MPYRTNCKPALKRCACKWDEAYHVYGEMYGPERHRKIHMWVCCRCFKKQGDKDKQFCLDCGHARDLRIGEEDELLKKIWPDVGDETNSMGPR